MSNAGDVLTLSDHEGTVYAQVSWGDCTGGPCAADHTGGALDIDQSVVRNPAFTGSWVPHGDFTPGVDFSPGVDTSGTPY